MNKRFTRNDLAKIFSQDEWTEPIHVLTRAQLAKELGVTQRTLKRWEEAGILNKPINGVRGAGRGNFAIYTNPLEGIISILTKDDDIYMMYVNGRIRWRKRRSIVQESITIKE